MIRGLLKPEVANLVDGYTLEYHSLSLSEEIGKGKFGKVTKAEYKKKDVAVKKILLTSQEETEKTFMREVSSLKRTSSCPFIVSLVGVSCAPYYTIVLDYWERGSLFSLIHMEKTSLSLSESTRILLDVAEALHFLHTLSPPIMHRDVTTRNILLKTQQNKIRACLADFGIAVPVLKKKREGRDNRSLSPIGRLRYMAPEVCLRNYTKKCDQFMYGHVIFECLVKKKPLYRLSAKDAAKAIRMGKLPQIPSDCPNHFANLMRNCWELKPKSRPSFRDICRRLKQYLD